MKDEVFSEEEFHAMRDTFNQGYNLIRLKVILYLL